MEFDLEIQEGKNGGAFVVIPMDIKEKFGKGRLPVIAMFDGIEYVGTIVKMHGEYILGIKKDIRAQLNKTVGQNVIVNIIEDKRERSVELPPTLKEQLLKEGILDLFNKMAFTHQKEYITWIRDAKKEETRNKRIEETIKRIKKIL